MSHHFFFEWPSKETLEIPNLVAEELDFKAVNILLDRPRFSSSLLVSSIWKRRPDGQTVGNQQPRLSWQPAHISIDLDPAVVEQDKQEHILLYKLTFLSQAYLSNHSIVFTIENRRICIVDIANLVKMSGFPSLKPAITLRVSTHVLGPRLPTDCCTGKSWWYAACW